MTDNPLKAGDLVRCVAGQTFPELVEGRHYRVEEVMGVLVRLEGDQDNWWTSHRFSVVQENTMPRTRKCPNCEGCLGGPGCGDRPPPGWPWTPGVSSVGDPSTQWPPAETRGDGDFMPGQPWPDGPVPEEPPGKFEPNMHTRHQWAAVDDQGTSRMEVPGGWIYRYFGPFLAQLVFVPNPGSFF